MDNHSMQIEIGSSLTAAKLQRTRCEAVVPAPRTSTPASTPRASRGAGGRRTRDSSGRCATPVEFWTDDGWDGRLARKPNETAAWRFTLGEVYPTLDYGQIL